MDTRFLALAFCSVNGLQNPLGMTNPLRIPGKCDSREPRLVTQIGICTPGAVGPPGVSCIFGSRVAGADATVGRLLQRPILDRRLGQGHEVLDGHSAGAGPAAHTEGDLPCLNLAIADDQHVRDLHQLRVADFGVHAG